MLKFFKYVYRKIIEKYNNPNNFNNNNTDNMESIIIPGHYKRKNSESDGKVDIIRVLGEDLTRTGYWKTQDKNSISDYELTENYELLDTKHSEKSPGFFKKVNSRLFDGIEDFDETPPLTYEYHSTELLPKPPVKTPVDNTFTGFTINPPITGKYQTTQIVVPEKHPFIKELFGKLNKSKNNKSVELSIELLLGFTINKLINSIELLDLSIDEVAEYMAENIVTREILKTAIKNKLENHYEEEIVTVVDNEKQGHDFEKLKDIIIQQHQEQIIYRPEVIEEPKIKEEDIESIDKRLSNLISKFDF